MRRSSRSRTRFALRQPPDVNTYAGLHAAYYDVIYGDKPYAAEARFVAEQVQRRAPDAPWPGRLLDLACGTGRHALEFAEMGNSVTGVDYSGDLLEAARRNAEERGADVTFLNEDIRELDVEDGSFGVITCLFDSIGYLLDNDAIVEALARARDHLAPGGALVLEFLHAAAMLKHASPVKVRRWPTKEGGILLRISEVDLDPARQTMQVRYELVDLKPGDAGYVHWTETQHNRFFSIDEMRALLNAAGLSAADFVPAYENGTTITDETWHVLVLARRAG